MSNTETHDVFNLILSRLEEHTSELRKVRREMELIRLEQVRLGKLLATNEQFRLDSREMDFRGMDTDIDKIDPLKELK